MSAFFSIQDDDLITSIYKNGILANKSCRYVNFLTF